MAEKTNPWKKEAERHTKQYENIRDMKFKDNANHKVRILPNKDADKLPYFGYVIHWIPQKSSQYGKPVVHDFEKRCIVCEYVNELWNEIHRLKEEENMTDKSPEIIALVAKVSAVRGQKKYDFNILDRSDMKFANDNGDMVIMPKRMSATKSIWEPIMEYAKKDEWGNPSDEDKGYDFEITTEGEGKRREYGVVASRSSKALTPEEREAIKLCYDLHKNPTTAEDLKEILNGAKAPYDVLAKRLSAVDDEEVVDDEPDEKPAPKRTAEKPAPAKVENDEVTPSEEAPETTDDSEDINNINNYQCKGENEPSDTGCKECPVSAECTEFKPIMLKAKELGLDVSETRSVQEIKDDVAEKSKLAPAASSPKGFKPKRPLPF